VTEQIVIDRRYCGPPKSGNGGYVGGLLAGYVEGTAEITLRLPPPIDTPLDIVRSGVGAKLMSGDKLVAEAQPIEIEVDVPPAPSWDEAVAAAKRGMAERRDLQYNSCFVCGLDRGPNHSPAPAAPLPCAGPAPVTAPAARQASHRSRPES